METSNKTFYLVLFILLVLLMLLGCKQDTKVETVVKTDTIYVSAPVASETIFVNKIREIKVPMDFVDITDDDSISIPIVEQRHYVDSTYEAWVSGVDPALDSIRVMNKKTFITITRVDKEKVPVYVKDNSVKLNGFVSGQSGFDMKHMNFQGGAKLSIRKFNAKVGYNVGEFNYPFWGIEYNF